MEEPTTIIIIGGGIVGLTLAMAIKKHLGITPEIYEKTSTFATEAGAGLGMYPNGLRVLRDISPELLRAVRRAGYPYKYRVWERHDGTEIMSAQDSILAGSEKDLEPIGIRRSMLQKTLYNFAAFQGIKVRFNKALFSAGEREDGLIEVVFEDGTKRYTTILFGADGTWGKTRGIVAGGKENPILKYTGVTCFMGLAKLHREGVAFPSSNQDDFHGVFLPTGKGEQCFQFHMPIEEKDANKLNWGNLSDEVGQAECQKLAAKLRAEGWDEKYVQPLEHSIRAVRVGFVQLEPKLKSWVRGRIALVGDSAHPPVPYLGQGAQQGLEDAGVIVSLLKMYCLNDKGKFRVKNFGKAMELYQKIRIKRSAQILKFSKSLGKTQAGRARAGSAADVADNVLKGEVLMYGTLPVMMNGAGHDYKNDILRATRENRLSDIKEEAIIEAMDYLLGIEQSCFMSDQTFDKRKQIDDAAYALSSNRVSILVDWVAGVLEGILKHIVARRNAQRNHAQNAQQTNEPLDEDSLSDKDLSVADEICEVIPLPEYSPEIELLEEDPKLVTLPRKVVSELRHFVTAVSALYRNNPFHNFEHACHVTVTAFKLLHHMETDCGTHFKLKDQTLKITDPLTEFACVLAALLHDADHEGVPNTQLQKERPEMDEIYKGKALAEQHSVNIGWTLFMDDSYKELRNTIYRSEEEMLLFRQLIVNIVLATDICDKELKNFRNERWEKAMHEADDTPEQRNRKATIGIEHLIQASDVSHTMQPFQVYTEWNTRLFAEMYKAYLEGRADKDPSEFWFKGEIGFFDFYIIPLAKKLEQCQIFGAAGKDFLEHAQKNREEWIQRGEGPVNDMIATVKRDIPKMLVSVSQ